MSTVPATEAVTKQCADGDRPRQSPGDLITHFPRRATHATAWVRRCIPSLASTEVT
jgi:hypothetical protein